MELWQLLKRLREVPEHFKAVGEQPDEIWKNDLYEVFVYKQTTVDKDDIPMTWLSIKRIDRAAITDWRHFQFIKNQICGHEAEAVQLYPAESRLVDGSNQYHLWVLPLGMRFPFGFPGRLIAETPLQGGKQRAWPKNMKPHDLEEGNELVSKLQQEVNKKKKQ